MQQALKKHSLERVIGKWIKHHLPGAKYLVAVCLFGRQAVENALRKAKQKANLPRLTIQSAGSEKILGYVRGNGTLLEGLKNGVAWNGKQPHEYFNLYGRTEVGGYYLLPYNVPISELPSEVFLMGVDNESESKEEMLKAVSQDGWALKDAAPQLQEDLEVVRAAVTHQGSALLYAARPLLEDRDLVFAALTYCGNMLDYALGSEELQENHNVFLAAAYQLLKDRDFVFAAVTQCGALLQYAYLPLRADREIVLAAVAQNGGALKYASGELQADIEVVLCAVTNDGWALEDASKELKNDKEVVLAAVTNDDWALEYASEELQNDPEIKAAAAAAGIED